MPQIAQQDYLSVPHINEIDFGNDMRLLAGLVKGIEIKTFFDIVVSWEADGDIFEERTIGYSLHDGAIFIGGASIDTIDFAYTATQYEGLAAVQDALAKVEGSYQDQPTGLSSRSEDIGDVLIEDGSGDVICDEDGHYITFSVDGDGYLASVAISEEIAEGGLLVPFEEIQKLIGLPIL